MHGARRNKYVKYSFNNVEYLVPEADLGMLQHPRWNTLCNS